MPGNEVEDGICNIYQLDNSSKGQHQSQVVGINWPVHDYNQWVGRPRQTGAPSNFNPKNYRFQQSDSVKGHGSDSTSLAFEQSYAQLSPSPEYSRSFAINNPLNTNDFFLGCHNFQSEQNLHRFLGESTHYDQQILTPRGISIFKSQQENDCADSPTLTTNSEKSEITEASSDFNFLRGQQQLVRDQILGTVQPHPMQQSGYDMQLLQQHMMLKQLQEIRRQQQLQQLGDVKQQNSLNQFSAIAKQAAGGQFSPLINGTPVHDPSQMLRNWIQRGASPAAQGVSNKVLFSQEQGQALRSMGLVPQQLDASLYGTPISNARGNANQYPDLQRITHDSVNLLTKASGQVPKSIIQSSGFGDAYLGDQCNVPSDLLGLPQGALMSKQAIQAKNNFGQVLVQGLNTGIFPGNLQEGNNPQANASGRQDQADWLATQQTTKLGTSQGLVPLDPMEAKILYNMDDNIWDAFGGRPDMGAAGFGNTLEHPDSINSFPSIQSGSWSALMQSAVAEASSSDTGLQEEWSGLTFQNTEHSTDNQISNFMDNEKQQTGWVDNNLQSVSFCPKPYPMITDSGISSTFPGFQQPGIQLSNEQREDTCHDGSRESIENYNPQQKSSIEGAQKVQTFMHSDNLWAGQLFDSQSDAQHQGTASSNTSMEKKGNEGMGKTLQRMGNGPAVACNSYEGANETYVKQQTCYPQVNSNDLYASEGFGGNEQGHFKQFKCFGNVSSSPTNVNKGSLSEFHGNSRVSQEVPSRGDNGSNMSTAFHGSVLPDGSNVVARTSEHMLELLHKVDQSRDDNTTTTFGSTDSNPLSKMPGVDSHDSSVAQLYNQSMASQGFGLRLAPPSQRLPNVNSFISHQGLQQTVSNLNSRQVNSELGEKSQTWLASPSSLQPLPPSNELSQRAQWDSISGSSGHIGLSSNLNVQGNSVSSFPSNPSYMRNQLQMHPMSNMAVASQASQVIMSGAASRYPLFNQVSSQDTSEQANPVAQQFPVLEASPVSQPSVMSGMSQQGEISARPHNVWRNVPAQRQPFGVEPLKFSSGLPSSVDPSNNSIISASWDQHGSNDQNSIKGRYKTSEFGVPSNSQGADYGKDYPAKQMSQHQISPKIIDTSQPGVVSQGQELVSDVNATTSGLLLSHSQQQNLDKAMNRGADITLEAKQATALGGQEFHDNSSRFQQPMDGGPSSVSYSNSFHLGDAKILSFPGEARDGSSVKASFQSVLLARPSQDMVTFGHNDTQTQLASSRALSNRADPSQVNLQVAPSWFKQYGTLRNGRIGPMFDVSLAKTAATQFSLGKPQDLHLGTSLERLDDAGQVGKSWPSRTATLVASKQSSDLYMLPSEDANQLALVRPKKRKIAASERLPWHKEVMHDCKRLQNISITEQEWARATNRLIEKVEDEIEMIEDVRPSLRSKRRLILTTQLMQQLFRPAPASIFLIDSASNYETVSYFVSRSSLGDTCSLACCLGNDLLVPINDSNMNSEKLKVSERSGDLQFLKIMEELNNRVKKLENYIERLDKVASIVDIKVELQELERFAVINRFAKFHVRGQTDSSGSSSSSGIQKSIAHRYVMALPMPRNLPEGVQCLSL